MVAISKEKTQSREGLWYEWNKIKKKIAVYTRRKQKRNNEEGSEWARKRNDKTVFE